MVSNFEAIYEEIKNQAGLIEQKNYIEASNLVTLVMEIVDAEDRNQTKPFAINKTIEDMIRQAARSHSRTGPA